jgi:hypothetical protein
MTPSGARPRYHPLLPGSTDPATPAPAVLATHPARRAAGRSSGSLANVDGQMVGIGDHIEGHRLVSVSDRQAIFEKDGRRIVLDMRRPLETRP